MALEWRLLTVMLNGQMLHLYATEIVCRQRSVGLRCVCPVDVTVIVSVSGYLFSCLPVYSFVIARSRHVSLCSACSMSTVAAGSLSSLWAASPHTLPLHLSSLSGGDFCWFFQRLRDFVFLEGSFLHNGGHF